MTRLPMGLKTSPSSFSLPMGLKTSPSSFSRVMTIAMSGLNFESCFVYLDDLIVFGNSLQNHNQNLIKVLDRLRQVNLKLNPVKCEFLKKEILYLGHFTTNKGQFQMTRLPMGLKTSPSSFSRVMTIAMSGLNFESCFVYLDDLIVFGNSLQNHNQNLIKVLDRLRQVNLKLNPVKCEFLKKEILYLGHVISAKGITPDQSKISTIQNYPVPKNADECKRFVAFVADECKRFVAFVNYYRKFIPNFASIAVPLNKLSRKTVEFNWDENCQEAFEELKQAIINPPILQYLCQ
ncbi:Reverse transcriptase (RNA-dependent DNA polymerase) [Popillia japonica]|uniref:RNA-directed DNA polymerase n=1 Tax=Popillia japonica TaxID=7064 RepID=A0AAW1N0H3_POPJA